MTADLILILLLHYFVKCKSPDYKIEHTSDHVYVAKFHGHRPRQSKIS